MAYDHHPVSPRRSDVSRIEGFSDAVFAFAITLLVVSLEVPKSFGELMDVIRAFPAFAITFAMIFQVWWRHYRFFRNYGLEDSYVIVVTGILLFVVLFYVYPLKFVWSLAFGQMQGRRITDEVISFEQVPALFVIYGIGVVAVFTLLMLLYRHAYALRVELRLTEAELLDTRVQIYRNAAIALWGILSLAIAWILWRLAPGWAARAGYAYFGIGISETLLGMYHGRERERIERAERAAALPFPP